VRAGRLDRTIVGRMLEREVLPRARACYRDALRRDDGLAGHVVLALEMARGEVHAARVTSLDVGDEPFRACLRDAAYGMSVPTVANARAERRFVVRYALTLWRLRGRPEVDGAIDDAERRSDLPDPLAPARR
jgi:hypothetical protein